MMDTLCIDNGSGFIKAGLAHRHTQQPALLAPNAVIRCRGQKRNYVAGQLVDLQNKIGLHYRRPFEDGYCTHVDLQRSIWAHVMTERYGLAEHRLLVTEPPFNFNPLRETMHELAFEESGFAALCCTRAADLAAYGAVNDYGGTQKKSRNPSCLVIDSGYAFTHVLPYINGELYAPGVRRLDVGGRQLTNYLKDLVSYRAVDLSAETYVVERMKVNVSQCVLDFRQALRRAATNRLEDNPYAVDYVLPDYQTTTEGAVASREEMLQRPTLNGTGKAQDPQVVRLNTERFVVPELLFHPGIVGMDSVGLIECMTDALAACDPVHMPSLAANVVVVGGNANIPGLADRIAQDFRTAVPVDVANVEVHCPDDPQTFVYRNGCAAAKDEAWQTRFVSKPEFEEHGHNICMQRFYGITADD